MDFAAILTILESAHAEAAENPSLMQWHANYNNGTISFGFTARQLDGNGEPLIVNGQQLYESQSASRQIAPPQP